MEQTQGAVDHFAAARGDFRASAKVRQVVTSIAVVLLDSEGEVLAGVELVLGNAAVLAFPVVGQEDAAVDADFGKELLAGRIVTVTQNPGPPGESGVRPSSGSKAFQTQHWFFFRRRSATFHRVARSRHRPVSRAPARLPLPCESI